MNTGNPACRGRMKFSMINSRYRVRYPGHQVMTPKQTNCRHRSTRCRPTIMMMRQREGSALSWTHSRYHYAAAGRSNGPLVVGELQRLVVAGRDATFRSAGIFLCVTHRGGIDCTCIDCTCNQENSRDDDSAAPILHAAHSPR
jgi:hypothetical protein